MDNYLIDFQGMSWENTASGVRLKVFAEGEQNIRLVEFSDEFVENDWCIKKHFGYVLEGSISIDFSGKLVNFKSGNGFFIPGGEASKHKGRIAKGEKALIILVEET